MARFILEAPKYSDLINTLEKHDLLPAIIFISSRRGCDEAAASFRGNALADLSRGRKENLLDELEHLSLDDQNFVRGHRLFHLLSHKGIASHHAGHLPAWKHAVEKMMSRGLLRAVFSTTTLAAGIDMPARSVVITASSLRDDEGHRDLKAFELAQMTGRAGRRGKDKVGFAIFIPGPFQDINLIVDLLNKDCEPIESQFAANYTMVLNLLQQHTPEAARDLLERSFSHYQRMKKTGKLRPKVERLEHDLEKDKIDRPCEDRIKTWGQYTELDREISRTRKVVRALRKKIKHELAADLEPETVTDLVKAETHLIELEDKLTKLPCLQCHQLKSCGSIVGSRQFQLQELNFLTAKLRDLEEGLWDRFEDCARILQAFNYLNEDWQPTLDGIWAAKLRVENALFISELVRTNYFTTDNPRLLAALCGALSAGDREMEVEYQSGEEIIFNYFKNAVKIARVIAQHQERAGIFVPIILDGDAARLLWLWSDTRVDWREVFEQTYADEGDVVRLILRTADLLNQLTGLQESHPIIADTARRAISLLRRAPIED